MCVCFFFLFGFSLFWLVSSVISKHTHTHILCCRFVYAHREKDKNTHTYPQIPALCTIPMEPYKVISLKLSISSMVVSVKPLCYNCFHFVRTFASLPSDGEIMTVMMMMLMVMSILLLLLLSLLLL